MSIKILEQQEHPVDAVATYLDPLEMLQFENERLKKEIALLRSTADITNPEKFIIDTELRRLYQLTVMQNLPMDKDDLKKFEVLTKAMIGLKYGLPVEEKKTKKKTSTEDALKRLMVGNE